MTEVETIEYENNLEAHVEKKKRRRRRKVKKVTSSDVTEGPNSTEPITPGPNATGSLETELDTPGQNETQKRKRKRRRNRNKKLQGIQCEEVIRTETKQDDDKNMISDSGNAHWSSGEGSLSVATVATSSNAEKKKRARRRKRNKPKTAEGSIDIELQTRNEVNSNVTNLEDSKFDLSHVSEGNLNVTNLEGINTQEKSEAQRKNEKKASISEGDVNLCQISEPVTNAFGANDKQTLSLPGKKRRNRKRKRNHTGNVAKNIPSVGDGSDKNIEENNDEPIVKMMKVSSTEDETPPSQNVGVGNGPNKKKRRRNRKKKYDKDKEKPQNNIDLPIGSQENGASIIEDNESVQNRKRILESDDISDDKSRLLDIVDSSLSLNQCVDQENNQTNIKEKNDGLTVKKARLSLIEEDGIPLTQNVGVGSGLNKKKRKRNRKRKYNKVIKDTAQNSFDLPAGSQENGVEVIKGTESAKGEKGGIERNDNIPESKKMDLLGIGEDGTNVNTPSSLTQLGKQEGNEIISEEKNDDLVKVSSLEEGGTPSAQNVGAGNNSYKKRHRKRKRKRNREDKEKTQNSFDLLDGSQENGSGIISGNENTESKKRGIEGKDGMVDSKKRNLISIGENGTIIDNMSSLTQSLEQGSNQSVPGKKKRRRNRKRKHNQSFQGTEIKDKPQEEVLCGVDVAQSNTDATVNILEPQGSDDGCKSPFEMIEIKDGAPGSDNGCNTPFEMINIKDAEVIESSTCGSAAIVTAELNTFYIDDDCKNEIRRCWAEKEVHLFKDTGLEVTKEPFTCCYAPDFLKNADYLEGVKDELQDIELIMKSNDLYKFRQTSDLKNITTPYIAGLRRFLYGDFRKWLIDVTGIPLNDTVDMGSSRYEYTDVLLCHDDELKGRRIAYILYLVPPWEKEDGGSLDLFGTDEHGQPKDIVKSFMPKWNAFAFFEVSPVSFHQVAEVLSCDKVRLSINGWFYGPPIERPSKYRPPSTPLEAPTHIEEEGVYSWINPTYLDMDVQREIRQKFRSDSEIELESFLAEDKYQELAEALKNSDLTWQRTGPANKNFFEALKLDQVPAIVDDCLNFLKSEAVFLIVSQLTGLKLHRLAPPDSELDSDTESKESCPRVCIDVRRWSHGCYTLIRDDNVENICALDANLFINVSDKWSQEHGGFISYIAKDEDEELLTVVPRPNRFALVYRDAETLKFTKHINASVSELGNEDNYYNDFACVYYE